MNKNEPGNLDNYIKRLRNEATHHIKNGILYIKRIYGPMRIRYDKDIIGFKLILKSKIKKLDNTYSNHLTLLNEILNDEKQQQLIIKETKQQAQKLNYEETKNETTKKKNETQNK